MMNELPTYKLEIRDLMQAAVNARLAEERHEIVRDLETLQRFCQVQDQAILGIVVLLVKARGVV